VLVAKYKPAVEEEFDSYRLQRKLLVRKYADHGSRQVAVLKQFEVVQAVEVASKPAKYADGSASEREETFVCVHWPSHQKPMRTFYSKGDLRKQLSAFYTEHGKDAATKAAADAKAATLSERYLKDQPMLDKKLCLKYGVGIFEDSMGWVPVTASELSQGAGFAVTLRQYASLLAPPSPTASSRQRAMSLINPPTAPTPSFRATKRMSTSHVDSSAFLRAIQDETLEEKHVEHFRCIKNAQLRSEPSGKKGKKVGAKRTGDRIEVTETKMVINKKKAETWLRVESLAGSGWLNAGHFEHLKANGETESERESSESDSASPSDSDSESSSSSSESE